MPAVPSTGTTQAPSQPSTYTPPSYAKTPSGATVNPATGSLVSSPSTASVTPAVPSFEAANTGNAASASSYSGSAGGAPGTYSGGSNPLITNAETEELFKKYLSSLSPSDQENADLQSLNRLNTAAAQAYTDTQNQPIALPFITGQQAAIQRSQNLLTQPLQSELAYLQAKRQTSSTAAKAALDFSQSKIAAARDLATKTIDIPFGGSVAQYDAATGTFKPVFGTAAGTDSATVDSWVNLIKGGQAQLSDVPQQLRQSVAQGMTASPTVSKANQDAIAQADTVMQKVDDILPMISATTTGLGAYLANVKGTPAYNLAAQLDTIKANVGFAALQAMRAASPTGGALGQVSEQENRLLQSTLASLDQGQSPEQLKENLAKVKLHFQNLKEILNAPINAQVSYDDAGNVVVTTASGGAFSGKSSQSDGSGSIYDW